MRRILFKSLLLCIVILALFSGKAMGAGKVMLVIGVSQEKAESIPSYVTSRKAIIEKLGEEKIVPEIRYVDFIPGDDKKNVSMGEEVLEKVRQYQPDVLIAMNDSVLKYVGTKIDDIPVVFTWVFGEPKDFGLPKANITGTIRRSYAPDNWVLAKKLFNIHNVALISKDGQSMQNRRAVMLKYSAGLEKKTGVKFTDMYLVNTLDEWKQSIGTWKEDLIHLADTTRILDGDRTVPSAEITQWTLENAKFPVIAAVEEDVKNGALFSIVPSERKTGLLAGEMALKISKGTEVASVKMQAVEKGRLVINAKTAKKYGVEIPYEILTTAEKIYQ